MKKMKICFAVILMIVACIMFSNAYSALDNICALIVLMDGGIHLVKIINLKMPNLKVLTTVKAATMAAVKVVKDSKEEDE